jgi:DNA replication and repair protein RecF
MLASRMRLQRITLQHFRNLAAAKVEFGGARHFLVGPNGQGKSNLLEAVGLLTALRSFRTSDARVLIAHGQAEAAVACDVEHERSGATRVELRLRPGAKEIVVDGVAVTRLADYLGQFPTVVLSSQDQQLVRGAPGLRRRWLDLTLAATDRGYLRVLQAYHRALAERNALLRRGAGAAELAAFERPMAAAAAALVAARASGLERLAAQVRRAYERIAQAASAPEAAGFAYAAQGAGAVTAAEWLARWEAGRARDLQMRTTMTGPHRDDVDFTLDGRPAADVGSEGQQRSLVLALRVAQAHWFQEHLAIAPLILADDVLGELDPGRRERFWAALVPEWQVIATGTVVPGDESRAWHVTQVAAGRFRSVAVDEGANA